MEDTDIKKEIINLNRGLTEILQRLERLEALQQPKRERCLINDGLRVIELESTSVPMTRLIERALIVRDSLNFQKSKSKKPSYVE